MVDVYGVDPIRAGAVLYALIARGKYQGIFEPTDATIVVYGETGTMRV